MPLLRLPFSASFSLLSLLLLTSAPAAIAIAPPSSPAQSTRLAQTPAPTVPVAADILAEVNRARTNPQAYADWLETLRSRYDGAVLRLPGELPIETYEGVAALDQAIAFLRATAPRPAFQSSRGMSQAAQDLVNDLRQRGAVGNRGNDGSTVGDRLSRYGQWDGSASEVTSYSNRTAAATVMLLILSDGNGARSQRNSLFSPSHQFMGAACGLHTTQQTLCVLNYAATYAENPVQAPAQNPVQSPAQNPQAIALSPTDTSMPGAYSGAPSTPIPSNADGSATASNADSAQPSSTDKTGIHHSGSSANPSAPVSPTSPTSPASPQANPSPLPLADIPTQLAALTDSDYYRSLQEIDYLSPLERAIVAETNRLRANPAAYADELAQLRTYYHGTVLRMPGLDSLETVEGTAALDEAIAVLRRTPPRAILMPSGGLSQAARDHVTDLATAGLSGHYGSDGSTPLDRIHRYGTVPPGNIAGENISFSPFDSTRWHVIQLVIDDDVPTRGHREALLRPDYRFTGVACGVHVTYGSLCGITYASDYRDAQ